MADGNNSEGFIKSRPVLGDLTNRLGKRGFSETEKSGIKISYFDGEDLAKRIRVSPRSSTEIRSLKGNVVSSISKINDENSLNVVIGDSNVHNGDKDLVDSCDENDDALPNVKDVASKNETDLVVDGDGRIAVDGSKASKGKNDDFEADDELSDGDYHRNGKRFDGDEFKVSSLEGSQSDVNEYQHDGDDHNADNLILPESQESRVFGVDLKKGNECAYAGDGSDSIKACSCSFCTKAGYIWMDLNYQDIKARVSALRKSQKEASIQAERIMRNKAKHVAESFTRVSELESDLIYQWRSLFQHMTDSLEQESNQLEARLLPLNDLREKCKTDLELMSAARKTDLELMSAARSEKQ